METIQIVRKCMLYIDWQPSIEAFRVGIFSLKWYSLLWMFGLMIAYMIVKHLYKQQGIPEEKFYPQFFYCFIGVLAGARLGHCILYQPIPYNLYTTTSRYPVYEWAGTFR